MKVEYNWKLIFLISSFIALFIFLFQPFGLSAYKSNYKTLVLLGYGGITFIILMINTFVIARVFKRYFSNWTILKQLGWISWIIFSIGIGNYFYSSIFFPFFTGINGFIMFQLFTLLIGVFPVVLTTLVTYNIQLSDNLKTAAKVNNLLITKPTVTPSDETVTLVADNNKDHLIVELSNLLFIESIGNYVQASYYHKGKLTKMVLRATIKRIETETEQHTSLVKCHRAYIVNLNQVESVRGNSQELKLVLKNIDIEIPVSRNNSQKIKNYFG